MSVEVMTQERMRQIVDENLPVDELVLDGGIVEFYEEDEFSIGVSLEALEEYNEPVFIFNLFLDGEYVNVAGEYVREQDGCFRDVLCPAFDVYGALANSWNVSLLCLDTVEEQRAVHDATPLVSPGAFVSVLIADCCDGLAKVLEVSDGALTLEMIDGEYSMCYPYTSLASNPLTVSLDDVLELKSVDLTKFRNGLGAVIDRAVDCSCAAALILANNEVAKQDGPQIG